MSIFIAMHSAGLASSMVRSGPSVGELIGHSKKIPCFPFHCPQKYMQVGGSLSIIHHRFSTNY